MSGLVEHVERFEVARLGAIFEQEPQCESALHVDDWVHNGPAAYWQIGNCEHSTGLRCAAVVRAYRRDISLQCLECGARAFFDDLRFVEL